MAPEIHARLPYVGTSVDLFASGIILFIMVAGTPPFSKADPKDPYYKLIVNKTYDTFWKAHSRGKPNGEAFFSPEFKDLIVHLLAYEPSSRPTLQQILDHPWTSGETATYEQIKIEFGQRYAKVEEENRKAREKKEAEAAKRKAAQANVNFTGFSATRRDESGLELQVTFS